MNQLQKKKIDWDFVFTTSIDVLINLFLFSVTILFALMVFIPIVLFWIGVL